MQKKIISWLYYLFVHYPAWNIFIYHRISPIRYFQFKKYIYILTSLGDSVIERSYLYEVLPLLGSSNLYLTLP